MEYWLYDGKRHYKVGLNAVVGRPMEERSFEPVRFDEMRAGAYDIDARVRDMDLNGVYASLNFPSSLAGFAGQRYQLDVSDPDLALAVVRAANDWHLEEWAGTHPGRIIPCQVPWLLDPELGAAEIRRNAERGFRAVTFPELPGTVGPAVVAHRLLGAAHRRVRGDGDGRVPARGLVVDRADHVVGRAVRHHRCAVLRLGDVRGGRLAVLDAAGALSRTSASACRRVGWAGWPVSSTGSTTSRATSRCTARGTRSTCHHAT